MGYRFFLVLFSHTTLCMYVFLFHPEGDHDNVSTAALEWLIKGIQRKEMQPTGTTNEMIKSTKKR